MNGARKLRGKKGARRRKRELEKTRKDTLLPPEVLRHAMNTPLLCLCL